MHSLLLQFFRVNTSIAARLLRTGLILLILFCFVPDRGLAISPAPDGGYPDNNTAEGTDALFSLQTGGTNNTAIGFQALYGNTLGDDNTATGLWALFSNTEGGFNTATGSYALYHNTTGNDDTATGLQALFSNTTGVDNTATGLASLALNTTGNYNTANGVDALFSNKTGNFNVATGFEALENNTIGFNNTANGTYAMQNNKAGHNNTAEGRQALQNNTSGSFNIAVGNLAGHNLTTGSNNIEIGNQGIAAEAKTIRIGEQGNQQSTFIAGISGIAVTGPAVHVNTSGKLGIMPSSARFKEAIKPMDKASETILALKPVTFRYKEGIDPDRAPQFGLLAEEVEKVDPDLVMHDEQGKPFTVRYEAVNAMLLNEFLKDHRKVEAQQEMIAKQQKQIDALISGLRKVSAAVEVNKATTTQVADTH
jgi:Chaperone of endosialidase